jgi:hypothetical protein
MRLLLFAIFFISVLAFISGCDVGNASAEDAPAPHAAHAVVSTPKGTCDCLTDQRCYGLVMSAYVENTDTALREIDGALPNRFFPDSNASTLGRPDAQGDFLSVTCGASRVRCDDKRDELEKRLIYTSFLSALPVDQRKGLNFEPMTWAIAETGQKLMKEARRCKPAILGTLGRILLKKLSK